MVYDQHFRAFLLLATSPKIYTARLKEAACGNKKRGKNRTFTDGEQDAAAEAATLQGCLNEVSAGQIALFEAMVSPAAWPQPDFAQCLPGVLLQHLQAYARLAALFATSPLLIPGHSLQLKYAVRMHLPGWVELTDAAIISLPGKSSTAVQIQGGACS